MVLGGLLVSDNHSLTPEEVAEILKIKKHTVYELVKRGDIPAFRVGRKIRINPEDVKAFRLRGPKEVVLSGANDTSDTEMNITAERKVGGGVLIISGLDAILDVLARHLETGRESTRVYRDHRGSFAGLMALYHYDIDAAGIHLWDSDSNQYNAPYVRRLMPGIPAVIVHMAKRRQGFYVSSGNHLSIKDWRDLTRSEIRFVNRESGCGTRVLLDEKLHQLKIDSQSINGYHDIENSHLAVASAVARGSADVGLGSEKAALQVRGIDFIPMQTEDYELAFRQEDINKVQFARMMEVLNSAAFKNEVHGLGDYDVTRTGQITARI